MATKALFRAEDIEGIQHATGKNYELVRGELYEIMPPSYRHGQVVSAIVLELGLWRRQTGAGDILVETGYTLERNPDTVRGPDISFVRGGRFPSGPPARGFPEIAPDVAFEVRSPNDRWAELVDKAQEYLAAGSRLAVLVEPDAFVELYRAGAPPLRLTLKDAFSVPELPGFGCKVADFFPQ